MPSDVLSQTEVENLLSAMASEGQHAAAGVATPAAPSGSGGGGGGGGKPREKIGSYDFKRPERVGKEQMRAL
jgi:flagellar motor switch protein FliM